MNFLPADLRDFIQDSDPDLVLLAARVLWERCASEEGAREVIARLKRLRPDETKYFTFRWYTALGFLARVRREFVADALCDLLENGTPELKRQALEQAAAFPRRRVALALLPLLEDKSFGPDYWWDRWCDEAAKALSRMLAYPVEFDANGPPSRADAFIRKLRAWWEENEDRLDWEDLDRKAEERLESSEAGGE